MPIEIPKDKWPGAVRTVTLGATAAEGGTRSHTVTVGGEKSHALHALRSGHAATPGGRGRNQGPPPGGLVSVCCWRPGATRWMTRAAGPKQPKKPAPI